MKMRFLMLLGLVASLVDPVAATAQLGGRPADEWAVVLESGRRLAGLDIDNVVRSLRLQTGDVVADIGAGTGIFSVPIARVVGPTGSVLAVEVDPGFLPMIEQKAREGGAANVRAVLGEFEDPRLPQRNVTVAFMHDVLHHIQDRQGYLRTLATYMAPDSRIAVVDYDASHPATPHQNEPEMLITPDQVALWMRNAGFDLVEEVDLFEEKFVLIFRRRN